MEKPTRQPPNPNKFLRNVSDVKTVEQTPAPPKDGQAPKNPKMIVEGRAVVFDTPTKLFEFGGVEVYETIDKNAFKNADLRNAFLKWNHSEEQLPLAGYRNKTLTFFENDNGIYFRAELADTQLGRDLYTLINTGVIGEMSFAFETQKRTRTEDEKNKRIDYRVDEISKVYDVAAVSHPAYDGTSIYARSDGDTETLKAEDAEREKIAKRAENIKKIEFQIKLLDAEDKFNN
jgi:HK97 family phage prohead protease